MDIMQVIGDVGFPIASALAGGFFVFLTLKFILAGVLDDIKTQRMFVKGLQNRIHTMNNELLRIDILISHAFKIRPDMNRISRSRGQEDSRKD
jgi:hypothetical protein